jgi:hypothetical protein
MGGYRRFDYLSERSPDIIGNKVEKGYMTWVVERMPGIEYINKGFNGCTATRIAEKINELGLEKDAKNKFLEFPYQLSGKCSIPVILLKSVNETIFIIGDDLNFVKISTSESA